MVQTTSSTTVKTVLRGRPARQSVRKDSCPWTQEEPQPWNADTQVHVSRPALGLWSAVVVAVLVSLTQNAAAAVRCGVLWVASNV
jgi:hypothetical protein